MDNFTVAKWCLATPKSAEEIYDLVPTIEDYFVTSYLIPELVPQVRDTIAEYKQYKYESLRLGRYKFAVRKKTDRPVNTSEVTDKDLFNNLRLNPPAPLYKPDTQVWFLHDNMVKQGWVHFVNVEIEYSVEGTRYKMDYKVKIYNGELRPFKENQLFLSKQELLNSL
jgi:hypothetical protein